MIRSGRRPTARTKRSTGAIQPIGVAAIVLILAFAGIVLLPVLTIFDLPLFQVEVSIQPAATVEGRTVHVSGTTDLPEGAVVVCYLADDQGTVGNSPEAKVTSGRFAVDLAVPTATVPLEADCRFGTAWAVQPKNVIDALGSRGERMTGPQVFRTGLTTPKELFASVPLGSIDGGGWPASSPAVSPGSS